VSISCWLANLHTISLLLAVVRYSIIRDQQHMRGIKFGSVH